MKSTKRVLREVKAERKRQDRIWGGPDHDDTHDASDWLRFIEQRVGKANKYVKALEVGAVRSELLKVAALAVAAVERLDRESEE